MQCAAKWDISMKINGLALILILHALVAKPGFGVTKSEESNGLELLLITTKGKLHRYDLVNLRSIGVENLAEKTGFGLGFDSLSVAGERSVVFDDPGSGLVYFDLNTRVVRRVQPNARCAFFVQETHSIVGLDSLRTPGGFASNVFIAPLVFAAKKQPERSKIIDLGHYAECPVRLEGGGLLFRKDYNNGSRFVILDPVTLEVARTGLPASCEPVTAMGESQVLCKKAGGYQAFDLATGEQTSAEIQFGDGVFPILYIADLDLWVLNSLTQSSRGGLDSKIKLRGFSEGIEKTINGSMVVPKGGVALRRRP